MIRRVLPLVIVAFVLGCDSTAFTFASAGADCTLGGVAVSPASLSMVVGDTTTVTASLAACQTSTAAFSWRSSNPAIARVDSVQGLVRAVGAGQASVIASVVGDTTLKGTVAVVVTTQ